MTVADQQKFEKLITALQQRIGQETGSRVNLQQIYLSAFSAGYGAVRAILRNNKNVEKIDGLILLDGLHTDYIPEKTVLATETTDYLIHSLGLKRHTVLKWGPLGMQQISEVKEGNFIVLGFAGNTAPDHIDHFQALYYFLDLLFFRFNRDQSF